MQSHAHVHTLTKPHVHILTRIQFYKVADDSYVLCTLGEDPDIELIHPHLRTALVCPDRERIRDTFRALKCFCGSLCKGRDELELSFQR